MYSFSITETFRFNSFTCYFPRKRPTQDPVKRHDRDFFAKTVNGYTFIYIHIYIYIYYIYIYIYMTTKMNQLFENYFYNYYVFLKTIICIYIYICIYFCNGFF